MTTESLWGDLSDIEHVRTPVQILREQAHILASATHDVLNGDIVHERRPYDDNIDLSLEIVVPALNGYRYGVLTVTHPVGLYPLEVKDLANETVVECRTEEDFIEVLRKILSSKAVKRIIASLLSQSRA